MADVKSYIPDVLVMRSKEERFVDGQFDIYSWKKIFLTSYQFITFIKNFD